MAKKAYIGVFKPEYEPVFADNTWAQIIKACQKNEVPDSWTVGDQKKMTINGTDYPIDIIGINHDDYSDGSGKAPLTFQMHDCYGTTYTVNSSDTNVGGWADSVMRNTHIPAVLALLPSEVKSGIKAVSKATSIGGKSSTINTTADKLFLLSESEIFGTTTYSKSGEGSQYAYYAAGNSKIKNKGGSATVWWERSPDGNNSSIFCGVSASGTADNYYASSSRGVAFAFCFGGTSEINNTFGGHGLARKIKKGYIGVDGVARKIKKAYIGIGGVARPCWSGGELAYYGTITALSKARLELIAASVGNYALFTGGDDDDNVVANVDAYDTSLTRTTATQMNTRRKYHAGASVGDYVLFAGGQDNSGATLSSVTAYNTSLTRSSPTALSAGRYYLTATSVGNYAIFGGGQSDIIITNVDAYNTSLTRSKLASFSKQRTYYAATHVGNYALFGGGNTRNANGMEIYDSSLTKISNSDTMKPSGNAAASVGNYALFGGGFAGSNYEISTVYAYDKSLTRTTPTALSVGRCDLTATSVEGFALFGGGGYEKVVDAYDASLTRTIPTQMNTGRSYLTAATVGNYALFGGGYTGGNKQAPSAVVDAYVVA